MTHLEFLIDKADEFGVRPIANYVLENPNFAVWSGSNLHKHHYGNGGLILHTAEIVKLCFSTIQTLEIDNVSPAEIYLSALYHDVGKLYDYAPITDSSVEMYSEWEGTEHKRTIHHISRSAVEWTIASERNPQYKHLFEPVLHNILSHHGCREWGSPVAPKSKAAWLLHLCDNLSARMNDCEKIDLLKLKK